MDKKDKIKWHPGFASALKLEFYENRNDLTIDELKTIIKKSRDYTEKDALMSIDSAMSVISQANTINLEIKWCFCQDKNLIFS